VRVVVVSCLLTLTACIGEPFTIGEIAPTDGGPVLAELAPDAVVARDSGAADPPDVSAVGTSQDGAANAFPDAGAEVDARRAEPPEAGESEASTTPEAATPEDAALEAEPLEDAALEAEPLEAAAPEAAAPEASTTPDSGACVVGETRCYYLPYAGSECSVSQAGYPQVCAIDQVGEAPNWGYPGDGCCSN
jgi:hypothetical protein